MPRRSRRESRPLPAIWQIPDTLWDRIEPVLVELDPPKPTGRPRIDPREALDAILYQLRTGCQWNHLPSELPDDSSVHRTFQRWIDRRVFDRVWADLVEACEDLDGVDWEWQSVDGCLGKARKGGTTSVRIRPTAPRTA